MELTAQHIDTDKGIATFTFTPGWEDRDVTYVYDFSFSYEVGEYYAEPLKINLEDVVEYHEGKPVAGLLFDLYDTDVEGVVYEILSGEVAKELESLFLDLHGEGENGD